MYRRPVELRGGSDGILEEAEAGEVDLDSEDCQRDQRGEDADGDLAPIVVGGADFGIEEARQEVPHQLKSVAVGLFQPLAQAVHAYFTSSMRLAMASVSSGLVSWAKTPSSEDSDMTSRRRATESWATTRPLRRMRTVCATFSTTSRTWEL